MHATVSPKCLRAERQGCLRNLRDTSRRFCHVRAVVQTSTPPQTYLVDESGRNPLDSPEEMPLLGKRILITAPRQYAHKLASRLMNAGARTLWVPGVTISTLTPGSAAQAEFDTSLRLLMQPGHGVTHIAFTSKNGIYAVLQRLGELQGGGVQGAVEVLRGCGASLCALGADGEVLLGAGLPLHVSPQEASTQGLVRELVSRGEAAGARVLCPVPEVAGGLDEPPVVPRFLAALSAAGAHALRVPAYATTPGCTASQAVAERGLLERGELDAIAFSSTAEAQGLAAVFGGPAALAAAVSRHGITLAAHGPYTAAGAASVLGVPVPVVSANFGSFNGLVAALEAHFTRK
uniref:Tetrapyrrole biosynthesis uroporphyrinogen III synthase domain-containing protein n=1 Tax=Chlamydomonas leiostraca TaxID=1034604 RepID=A0A7S0WU85_9CHLO